MEIKNKTIHFIGIGGIGMSAMARMCMAKGAKITGYDQSPSEITKALETEGVVIHTGLPDASHLSPNTSLVVYTIAIPENNPELMEAKARGIEMKTYPQMLGIMTEGHRTIAISGTHGKTTTTAMTIGILKEAGLNPHGIVGSLMKMKDERGSEKYTNYVAGSGEYFVIEACEYKRSFLNVRPFVLVITNIDNDHLDYYKDIADIQSAFSELASFLPENGALICDTDDELLKSVISATKARVIDYKKYLPEYSLQVPGIHNKKDGACALAVADFIGVENEDGARGLKSFSGTWRRFEKIGITETGAVVYDDYGHHPTEVSATLRGARELFPNKKIIVAFHPHLFSRTKLLLPQFATAFKDADEVVLAPIFPAREAFDPTISSEILAGEIAKTGTKAIALPDFESIVKKLQTESDNNTLIMTMGAGDIYKVAQILVNRARIEP